MAQPQEEEQVPSTYFPAPPPFYKDFTSPNQQRLKRFTEDAGISNENPTQMTAAQLLSLPPELRFLIPPEPPADDEEFRVFGEVTKGRGNDDFAKLTEYIGTGLATEHFPALPGWEYEQLYPSPPTPKPGEAPRELALDRQVYLKDILRSILHNFVELLGILALDPTSEDKNEKLKDITTLVANMHALINDYRPHQARETLIHMMEDQLERKKAEVEGIKRMKEKVQETLGEFAKAAPDKTTSAASEGNYGSVEEQAKEIQRHMWTALDEILGH